MNDPDSLKSDNPILVITTINSAADAERLADLLVGEKAAACVSISSPVTSIYRWRDNLEREEEFMLLIKTVAGRYGQVEALIQQHHGYDLPEILAVPVESIEDGYRDWLIKNTPGS